MGNEPILEIKFKANGQSLLKGRGKSGLPMNTKPGKVTPTTLFRELRRTGKPGEHINPMFTDSATENNRLHLIVCGKGENVW